MDRQAIAWILERRWPNEFGRVTRQDGTMRLAGPGIGGGASGGGSEEEAPLEFKIRIVDPKKEEGRAEMNLGEEAGDDYR